MRDVSETIRDAWWVTLVIPLKLAWRHLWRMVIFATKPDLFDRLNQDYEREHRLRVQQESENATLRSENDRLRNTLVGLIDSSSNAPDGTSPKRTTER